MADNYFSSFNLYQKTGVQLPNTDSSILGNSSLTSGANSKLFNFISSANPEFSYSVSGEDNVSDKSEDIKDNEDVSAKDSLDTNDVSKELESAKIKLEEDKNKLEAEKVRLELEQTRLEQYIKEYEQMQEQLEKLNETIASTQEKELAEYQDSVNNIINKAMSEYNPEKDGSNFEQYVKEMLASSGYATFSSQELDSLNSSQKNIAMKANNLLVQISVQSSVVNGINGNLATLQANFDVSSEKVAELENKLSIQQATMENVQNTSSLTNSSEVAGAGLTAKELLSKIDPRELDIVKQYNVDMKNCVVAKGIDGKFHIYEKLTGNEGYFWGEYGNVARKYCPDMGFDICPMGSGEIGTLNDATDCDVQNFQGFNDSKNLADQWYNVVGEVYTFTSINDCLTDGEICSRPCSYCTASPLSFDIDGDGVNTSDEIIKYDIDGDGKLDTINNSAEWVLAFDADKNGIAGEDGGELFGDNTDLDGDGKADGYKDGFEALKALAEKENLIDENDRTLDKDDLSYLGEKYGLVMTNGYGGEAKSLDELGVDEINLAKTDETTLTKNFDGKHNDIMTQEGATFKVNGQTREYADIWNAKFDSGAESESNSINSNDLSVKNSYYKTIDNENSFSSVINKELLVSDSNCFIKDITEPDYDEILNSEVDKAVAEYETKLNKKNDKLEENQK